MFLLHKPAPCVVNAIRQQLMKKLSHKWLLITFRRHGINDKDEVVACVQLQLLTHRFATWSMSKSAQQTPPACTDSWISAERRAFIKIIVIQSIKISVPLNAFSLDSTIKFVEIFAITFMPRNFAISITADNCWRYHGSLFGGCFVILLSNGS